MCYDKLHWRVALTCYQSYKNFNRLYTYILKKLICNFCYKPPNSIYTLYKNDWVLLSSYINDNGDSEYSYAIVINIIPNDFDIQKYVVVVQFIHTGKIMHLKYNSGYSLLATLTNTEVLKILDLNTELVNKLNNIQKKNDMYSITNRIIRARTNVYINWQ